MIAKSAPNNIYDICALIPLHFAETLCLFLQALIWGCIQKIENITVLANRIYDEDLSKNSIFLILISKDSTIKEIRIWDSLCVLCLPVKN